MISPNIFKFQIVVIAMRIMFTVAFTTGSIHYCLATIGIDTHADYPALSVVDIKGDVGFSAGGDIAHLDVVKEEGRADQIRLADDFKAAFSQAILIRNFIHKHRQSEGCLFRKAMQK